jgi:molecular chaperone HtpG
LLINIPEALANKLKANSAFYGAILQSLSEFEPWFANSGTPFFPEYTDHGPRHIAEAISTGSSLIRDEAWPVLTPTDAGTLILAILLHDSAMHLSEDGFLSLIGPNPVHRELEGWVETPWPDLWLEFLSEASRFDSRKLTALFGDTEPVTDPKPDPRDWTLRDRLLIGEFVRRHHARLAHETALYGVPGPGNPILRLNGVEPDLADLAGLVARSHGMPIRAALPHLEKYDVREYKGIHAPFLMSVLRIADYLQVHSERAPRQILSIKQLRSPISQREWKSHAAIRDIRTTHEDPEAIFIDAAPTEARTFLRLKGLLGSIQEELDASWAVLGEVYGRYAGLNQLGLNLRRVRSNIDDVAEFAKSVPYLPYEAAFDSAGPELLKLLIEPLYGEHPEIGIRELLQNAVDACRELKDFLDQRPGFPKPDLARQEAEVVLLLEEKGKDSRWLEVSDRGIGMTADVVRGYFLKAGASFRRSDAWRRLHEDESAKSRVLRSGRFGIGVLAAFLLGEEVEVLTRHVSSPADRGLRFTATIDAQEIEIRYCTLPVGTTIRVRINDEGVWNGLYDRSVGVKPQASGWDWYCLDDPKVARAQASQGRRSVLEQQFRLPGANASLSPEWRRITHPDYKDIQWSYWQMPSLSCNGIKVRGYARSRGEERLGTSGHVGLKRPNVSVFDPDGYLPLVLQRNALATEKYPFQDRLFEDVLRDWLAFILAAAPDSPFLRGQLVEYVSWYAGIIEHWRARHWPGGLTPFCSAAKGVLLADPWHLQQCKFHRLLFLSEAGRASPSVYSCSDLPDLVVVPVGDIGSGLRYR